MNPIEQELARLNALIQSQTEELKRLRKARCKLQRAQDTLNEGKK